MKFIGSDGLGTSGQVMERKSKRDGYICMAQLLNTFGVTNSGGNFFEQCPHGSQCVFDHVKKQDKSKAELKKAVDLSKAKLLTKTVRRSLLLAIQKP
jgi:hypothetical protein